MLKRKHILFKVAISLLLTISCQFGSPNMLSAFSDSNIYIIEENNTKHQISPFIQILDDSLATYTIQEIVQTPLQSKFIPYADYLNPINNYKYYWGKIQIENRLTEADRYTEWVLYFTDTWSNLEVFTKNNNGNWERESSGAFTPDTSKKFVPTAKGNFIKINLPPQKVITIYFRGISERTAIKPSFNIRLKHIETFYDDLVKTKIGDAIFIGFLLMMFFYNLIAYFLGKDHSFIFYSGYLLMVVIYSAFSSEDLVDWFGLFRHQPAHLRFMKLSLYLSMMFYLAFIRSFLDLEHLLPKWDKLFKFFI